MLATVLQYHVLRISTAFETQFLRGFKGEIFFGGEFILSFGKKVDFAIEKDTFQTCWNFLCGASILRLCDLEFLTH